MFDGIPKKEYVPALVASDKGRDEALKASLYSVVKTARRERVISVAGSGALAGALGKAINLPVEIVAIAAALVAAHVAGGFDER